MAVTQKISVAMGRIELRLAKTAAEDEGVSLSAFVTRAVRERLEEREREEARREILATFLPHEIPSAEEQRALASFWNREGPAPSFAPRKTSKTSKTSKTKQTRR
jgi:hypothetical protein